MAGVTAGGARRAVHQAEYGWRRDGRRVACKSAQLIWDVGGERWRLLFANIKRDAFDELLLAAYTPEGVYLFRHDERRAAAASTAAGRAAPPARGSKQIAFAGPREQADWRHALDSMLTKMEAKGWRRLAFVPWDHS